MFKRGQHMRAIAILAAMIAIVHQHNIARAHGSEPRNHGRGWLRFPVAAHPRPIHDSRRRKFVSRAVKL